MIRAEVEHKIIPVKAGDTIEASKVVKEQGITADLIYVDAGHTTEEVEADLAAYYT